MGGPNAQINIRLAKRWPHARNPQKDNEKLKFLNIY